MFAWLKLKTEKVSEIREMLVSICVTGERIDAALAEARTSSERARRFDENAYRARVRAELEADSDIDWNQVAERLGLKPAQGAEAPRLSD